LAKLPKLAFDHPEIIAAARQALIARLDREPLALALLPPRFTLTQLQKVYEAIEGPPSTSATSGGRSSQRTGSVKPATWSAETDVRRCCTKELRVVVSDAGEGESGN